MCCTWLAENTGCKNDAKNRHLGTNPQLCWAMSSQLRHVSTIRKKLVKQQYLLHMGPQYGELRPTSGWDRFGSLGHPSYFQRLPRLGSVTYCTACSSGRQPNFAALNGGRHLCSAGRPSRWALAHILVIIIIIKNALIEVTLHTKVLQGHFTVHTVNAENFAEVRNYKGCIAARLSGMMTETVTSLNAVERSARTVRLWHWLVGCSVHAMPPPETHDLITSDGEMSVRQ